MLDEVLKICGKFYEKMEQCNNILQFPCTGVQIIRIWKCKQNIRWKTCHTWIWISTEQKMVETNCKKY